MSDEIDDILDKIKNRWSIDLTEQENVWDDNWMLPEEKRETNEKTSGRDVPKRANRSRKSKQRYRNRK